MCDRTGAIIDDGVACRLAQDHFYVTATTGGVDSVYREMLWHNAQWRLDVDIANVTAAWCGVNIAGPRARAVLEGLAEGVDLSAASFPYLGVRTGRVAGIPARLLRVGFVGELGYEIHVPASCGEALWDALIEAGAAHGIRPFGVEAQRLLRLEKGHIIVGQDTDGLTTPDEAGMAWAVSRAMPFFVGGRATEIQARRARGAQAGRLRAARGRCRAARGMLLGDPGRRDRRPGDFGDAIARAGPGDRVRLRPAGRRRARHALRDPPPRRRDGRRGSDKNPVLRSRQHAARGLSMAATEPAAFTRRSFIYRRLAVSGATFAAVAGAAVALDFGDRGAETDRARRLGLADLSPLLRTGFKGHAALGWLAR